MKKLILLFFICLSQLCLSQDKNTNKFFNDIYSNFKEGYSDNIAIYYSEEELDKNFTTRLYKQLKEVLNNKSKFYGFGGTSNEENLLEFSNAEKEYIIKEAKNPANFQEKDYLSNIEGYESFKKLDRDKHHLRSFLSKPIFIRNNTLCIIYTATYSGMLSAGGGWKVYKFKNGKWKTWINLTMWIS